MPSPRQSNGRGDAMFDQAARDEITRVADTLGVEPAALLAVAEVESAGKG